MVGKGTVASVGREGGGSRLVLGYYVPFAGVRYYGLFTEEQVRRGEHIIGPVGWRRRSATAASRSMPRAA